MNPQIADYEDYENYVRVDKVRVAMFNASNMLSDLTRHIQNSEIPQMRRVK